MTKDSTSTAVYLNPQEADLFVTFQKHFSLVQLLESIGGFQLKNGSIELHFDSIGRIASVDKRQHFRPNSI